MLRSLTLTTALLAGALAAPAFAQAPSSSASSAAAASAAAPPHFVTKESPGQWRATKLSGVAVYSADHQKIGSIDDILLDADGQAKVAVIGIGGFLGVGQKNVAVPFDSLKWSNQQEGRTSASGSSSTSSSGGSNAGSGSPEYPASAMLNATKQQLQNAPTFQYASAAGDENRSSAGAPGANGTMKSAPATTKPH